MRYHETASGSLAVEEIANPEFEMSFDIIVVGLGSSGAFCAISAAQEGARVLGIERHTSPGCMCVLGGINSYYFGGSGGLYQEIDAECHAMVGKIYREFGHFHPDAKKYVLERRMLDSGVTVSYDSVIMGLYEQGGKVAGIRFMQGGSVKNAACAVLVDATSDGHIIRMSGAATTMGRDSDGQTQPFTSAKIYINKEGRLSRTNLDSGYVNQYDDEELSAAIIASHSEHESSISADEPIIYLAPRIGVREGVAFEGEARVTLEDVLNSKRHEDTLIYAYCDIDRHGLDAAFDDELYQEWVLASNLCTVNLKISLPLGAFIPKGISGLISTGRCYSADSYVIAAARMSRDMHRLGEACGVAAAMALKNGGEVRGVDIAALRENLKARRCYEHVGDRPDIGFEVSLSSNKDYVPVTWLDDMEEIGKQLATVTPGAAIWSCRRLGSEVVGDALCEMMQSENEHLRYNSAIALGITGDGRALPVLREIVKNRKAFFFEDCRRTNQLRSVIAIYLCGKLKDAQSAPELITMLSAEEFERPMYHEIKEWSAKYNTVPAMNGVYYQHLSNAVIALIKIADAHSELGPMIRQQLEEKICGGEYIKRVTNAAKETSHYKNAYRLTEFVLGGK